MKIKTSELTGAALDWAVAKCEKALRNWPNYTALPHYSTEWCQGGPIIEREYIDVLYMGDGIAEHYWRAEAIGGFTFAEGPSPLVAAMRCYVASKLGDAVDVPEELS